MTRSGILEKMGQVPYTPQECEYIFQYRRIKPNCTSKYRQCQNIVYVLTIFLSKVTFCANFPKILAISPLPINPLLGLLSYRYGAPQNACMEIFLCSFAILVQSVSSFISLLHAQHFPPPILRPEMDLGRVVPRKG